MSQKTAINKISTSDGNEYNIFTEVEQDCINLLLTDFKSVWRGKVSHCDMKSTCKKIHMDFDDYLTQTTSALTGQMLNNMNFQYVVQEQSASAVLTWKKYIPGENIKFQLGTVKLEKEVDTVQHLKELFDYSLKRTQELESQINVTESKTERLSMERDKALSQLKKSVETKELLEKGLYSKFVLVLNSKKEKIKELKAEIDELHKSQATPRHAPRPIDEASDDDGSDTDVEASTSNKDHEISDEVTTDDETVTLPKRSKVSSTNVFDVLDGDSSLVLDNDDEKEEDLTLAPRRRRAGGQKSKTPTKTVLPKVPSELGSLRKSTSNPRPSPRISKRKTRQKSESHTSLLAEDLVDFM